MFDPLSEVLSILKPRTYVSVGLDAGGNWAIRFPAPEGVKFNAVTRGTCWLKVQGDPEAHKLREGDCFLLTRARPFTLASDLSLPPTPADEIYDVVKDGIAKCNGGGDFFLVGGRFVFTGHADFLFGNLSSVVHVNESFEQASVLRWGLERLAMETRARQPGGHLIAEHLAHIMLVQVLRVHLQSNVPASIGWLFALADNQMSKVIGSIHSDLAHRRTLQELAKVAGMSRSNFAFKFRKMIGISPVEYVTRWRMLVAADRLSRTRENIAEVAAALGYESEAAFSTAFKRVMSRSPKQYRDHTA